MPPKRRLRELIQDALAEDIVIDDIDLDRAKYPDLQKARDALRAMRRQRKIANLKAAATVEQYTAAAEAAPGAPVAAGRTKLGHVEKIPGGVEIWLGEMVGAPDYRIINPPSLVLDPAGDIEVQGQMYREDPLAALAAVIESINPPSKRLLP